MINGSEFADYIVNTALTSHIASQVLPTPHIWTEPDFGRTRTTNGCESFHSQFGDMFYLSHHVFFSKDKIYLSG